MQLLQRFEAKVLRPVAWTLTLLGLACLCAPPCFAGERLQRFEFEEPQMGVPFRIVLYSHEAHLAEAAARKAFNRVSQLNSIFSDYDSDSEISRLSQSSGSGEAIRVSPELWLVLDRAQSLSMASDGGFDVTVGPLVNLWRKARREKKLPDPERLADARQKTGFSHLRLNPKDKTAALLTPGMRLDFGAIAKGYAADQALLVLRGAGISRALVSGGGDMAMGDAPPGQRGWRIALAALDVTSPPGAEKLSLANRALATSGDLSQHLEIDGKRYSHIVDPRTGVGLTDHSLVVVIAKDCLTADALSTCISVVGPKKGLALAKKFKAQTRIVRKPADRIEFFESTGFRKSYLTSDSGRE